MQYAPYFFADPTGSPSVGSSCRSWKSPRSGRKSHRRRDGLDWRSGDSENLCIIPKGIKRGSNEKTPHVCFIFVMAFFLGEEHGWKLMMGLDWRKLAQKFSKGKCSRAYIHLSTSFDHIWDSWPKSPMETSNAKNSGRMHLFCSYSPLQTGRATILLNIKKRSLLAVNLMMFFLWFHIQNTWVTINNIHLKAHHSPCGKTCVLLPVMPAGWPP